MREDWKYGQLSDGLDKGSSNLSINKLKDDEGQYPLYGAKGFVKGISFYHQENDYLAIIKDGAGVGRISIHKGASSVVGTLQYLLPKDDNDIRFLYYYLLSIDWEKYFTGSTIPHIYFKDYKSEPFPLVHLAEQKQIVAILDKAFSVIERSRNNIEKNIANAQELFQSKLNEIFSQPARPSGGKGDGWEVRQLQDITEVKDGTHDSPKYVEEGIPFVTQKNITDAGLTFEKTKFISQSDHDNFYKRSNVSEGDILVAMIGANRGMSCIVDDRRIFSIKNVGLIKLSDSFNNRFILYYLKSPLAKKYIDENSKGSAQGFIGLGKLRQFEIPFTDIANQERIVKRIDSLKDNVNQLLVKYEMKLSNLSELKKSILQKAFAGELTKQLIMENE